MTETKYWQALRKFLVPMVYAWKINANYAAGVPDWYGSGMHQDLWIENKRIKNNGEPPESLDLTDYKHYLTVNQQLWLKRRHNEGRNTGVLVFSKRGHVLLLGDAWQKPISRKDFLEAAMPPRDMAVRLINILGELPIESQKGLK